MKHIFETAKKYRIPFGILSIAVAIGYYFCLPDPLFQDPVSTVVLDRKQTLLGARIASDGQWRFPHAEEVPNKFQTAIICFEDKRFESHPGVDVLALLRAFDHNIHNNRVISGGSTLSMQVIRLARKGKSRTMAEKFIEIILATRLELRYSKKEIMALYVANAPFGGNVVGLEAAAWKYYGRSAAQLSWAETATLAVLPNSPALIHPGRNRQLLQKKRDRLLNKLYKEKIIDSVTYVLSKKEQLPERPLALPDKAPHLTETIRQSQKGDTATSAVIVSTIDIHVQQHVQHVIDRHYHQLKENNIYNAAALVIDTETGDVIAYIGNTTDTTNTHHNKVDIVHAKRSSGSILKPLLYTQMLNAGEILPNTLVPDIPTHFNGYTPKNFDLTYDGAVPASKALARSLNIPAARMLQQHGTDRFYNELKKMGMTTLDKSPMHYGLSLILGGAETSLWDLGAIYSSMGRTLKQFHTNGNKYDPKAFRPLNIDLAASHLLPKKENMSETSLIDAAAIWHTFESMSEVVRPDAESNWQNFESSGRIAWKTGTSFGFRDGWAVGCTPQYVVAVWTGNADGEGRPGLTGISAAAPILFDIFHVLEQNTTWFQFPTADTKTIQVCKQSGHKAGEYCTDTEALAVPQAGLKTFLCPYHIPVYLDAAGNRVNGSCISPTEMIIKSFFVLPPIQALYYKRKNPDYASLPAFRMGCTNNEEKSMAMIYPHASSRIYIPVNLDGTLSKTVFQVTHPRAGETIYWHVDDFYVGETNGIHELALCPEAGSHILTLIDSGGEVLKIDFEVLENLKNKL
ncbi:MAG TPA: penicillin-binding protein 1C [Cytophaga sp.]|nr:penicillin-binding protein 1C [Cytophaga sp.]